MASLTWWPRVHWLLNLSFLCVLFHWATYKYGKNAHGPEQNLVRGVKNVLGLCLCLICIASALVAHRTHDWGVSTKKNIFCKHRHQLYSNQQSSGLQYSAVTAVPSEYPELGLRKKKPQGRSFFMCNGNCQLFISN